jgi:hypothetical protein
MNKEHGFNFVMDMVAEILHEDAPNTEREVHPPC